MRWQYTSCLSFSSVLLTAVSGAASSDASHILNAPKSVHSISEVTMSPDGRHVVFGSVITGKRGGADVDVTALWLVDAREGSNATQLTACSGTVCDEHGAVWSPDGSRIAFVTTDANEQSQIAVANTATSAVTTITSSKMCARRP